MLRVCNVVVRVLRLCKVVVRVLRVCNVVVRVLRVCNVVVRVLRVLRVCEILSCNGVCVYTYMLLGCNVTRGG